MRRTVQKIIAIGIAVGCAACSPELETGTLEQEIESENALSLNALSLNALSLNALSLNALSLNALSLNGLTDTASGRELTRYLVRCALTAGDSFTITYDGGESETYAGVLGLAPYWESSPLSGTESSLLSGCLLAHANYFGVWLHISARHPALATTTGELDRFTTFEGAFFGDLFSDPPVMYACTGDPAPDFSNDSPNHKEGDRLFRRCTDVDGSETTCGFQSAGSCASACTVGGDGTVSDCGAYPEAIAVWLLDHKDGASRWPDLYDNYYDN